MTTTDARKRIQDHINAMHEKVAIAMTGAWPYPPTEPTPQEHDMSDRDRRADAELYLDEAESVESRKESAALSSTGALSALLAIHDLLEERLPRRGIDLTPQEFTDFLAAAKGEPVDVTEEPPVGSQVTDKAADVWQRFERDWRVIAYEGEAVDASRETGLGWGEVRNYAPLLPTTDADRERVGLPTLHRLEDVAEEFGVDLTDTAPDVDPDEALRFIHPDAYDRERKWHGEQRVRAEKAEAEVERLNGKWDEAIDRTETTRQALLKAEAKVERLTRERDEARVRADGKSDLAAANLRSFERANSRYRALRVDVQREGRAITSAITKAVCSRILARDDERGRDE